MPKDLAQRFGVHAAFYAACHEGVSEGMKMNIIKTAGGCEFLKMVGYQAWFNIGSVSGQQERVSRKIVIEPPADAQNVFGKRYIPDRTLAFGLGNNNLCS